MVRAKSICLLATLAAFQCRPLAAQQPATAANAPVYSWEAVEINGQPISGGPAARITIAPGDTFTMKLMLRDWSPNGEKLRGYQAMVDSESFKSGKSGAVQPIDFGTVADNAANAFIDRKEKGYVQPDLDSIPIVDAAAVNYRFMNVILEADRGPVAKQDGKKFICGTLKMKATPDASGTFTIKLVGDPDSTSLLTPDSRQIDPLTLDPIVVEVSSGAGLKLAATDPPNGAIDARKSESGKARWNSVQITLSEQGKDLKAEEFQLDDGTIDPPKVQRVNVDGSIAMLTFDRPVRSGFWTRVTHKSGASFRLGALPGDVNNDGAADSQDVGALIDAMNSRHPLPLFRTDIDADGKVTSRDLSALVDLLGTPGATNSRLRND